MVKPGLSFKTALLLPVILWVSGCSSLKYVSDYSSTSLTALNTFEELHYNFAKACNDKCLLEQLDQQQLFADECDCTPEDMADSVMLEMYTILKYYIEGLSKLSDNTLADYCYADLTKNISEGTFGPVIVSEKQAAAFEKITTTLTNAITNRFRKKKLKAYISDANAPLQVITETLQFNLTSNLIGRLNTQKQRLKTYSFDLLKDPSISAFEKKQIIERYNKDMLEIDVNRKRIELFSGELSAIAKGHDALYQNKYQLSDKNKNLMGHLAQYSATLAKLITEFNTLKSP